MALHWHSYGRFYMCFANICEFCVILLLLVGTFAVMALAVPHKVAADHPYSDHSFVFRILLVLRLRGFVILTRGYISYRKVVKVNNLN